MLGALVVWLILGIFLIATIILLSGKGSNLVAGFNSMSKDEKAKYDEIKVSKEAGKTLAFADVGTFVFALYFQFRVVSAINKNIIESMGGEIVLVALGFSAYIIVLCIVSCIKGFKNCRK